MKLMIIFSLVILSISINAQDKRFTSYAYTEPMAYDDGFNIGLAIEYQMTIMYFKVQTFIFPDLNGISYFDLQGTILGFNYHYNDYRLFLGGKTGIIKRDKYIYPVVGVEFGLERYFNSFYIGGQGSWDFRMDDKYWNAKATGYWRYNAGIKIGFYW